ncbi:hypothetical protein, variant 1 [Phytophthora nicotianae CJ01A1]|uniref:PH domain-containing protein n=2 Tax=Phytophthora nicotianae TaxID=4792 RepID=W2I256_PHYNI|nr:hypothetical protein, variant 1 [Phytophthora nicotianae]ETL28241.1 hypothetical protein, variant 1 [Phytophthora nicotianae]ETM34689.1 hypothetical protein, variant 1 [Phytophthora nicotianae]ETP04351.1 hypothetical protein, variant 1 [Phytophthora nicotianae CJ01A1]
MRSRWVDSLKRGISASPRPDERSPQPSGTYAPTPSSTLSSVSAPSLSGAENPSYVHDTDRCDSIGACSVARVLDNCVLQGGVHHTHMHVLTYLGRPLRSECCCYPVAVQWFRAVGEQDDFQVIPGACDEWYTPTADDIGARILAKVMIEDEDVLKTKMLEYGPIKEDPEVRSKVEMYLERKSVLFMGLRSISVQDSSEYLNEEELRESWTLLIDDRRVRLTCESSLIPPFESLYTPDIKLEMVRGSPNEFYLHLAQGCYVRLRAESNTVRDIIVLTLRAFCQMAVADESTHEAVARGLSPMLTLRKIAQDEESKKQPPQTQEPPPPPPVPVYDLPWNRSASNSFSMDPESTATSTVVEELEDSLGSGSRRPSIASSLGGMIAEACEGLDDSLLMDAEALIGNAQKMGIQYQILPRAPKRISILDIPDLQIIETMDILNDQTIPEQKTRQQRDQRRRGSSSNTESEEGNNVDGSVVAGMSEMIDASCIDKAIEDFMADGSRKDSVDVAALRERYVAIFCSLQRELHTYKQRVVTLSKQLEEKQELNSSFRKDIESLRSALTSMQLADKVYDLVSTDLQQLVKRNAAEPAPVPNVLYSQ